MTPALQAQAPSFYAPTLISLRHAHGCFSACYCNTASYPRSHYALSHSHKHSNCPSALRASPDIGRLAAMLGRMYRLSTSGGQIIIPVKHEIEHLLSKPSIPCRNEFSMIGCKMIFKVISCRISSLSTAQHRHWPS